MKIETITDIDNLITSEIQENSGLEYKRAQAIDDKDEISKDVSAMANAGGGTIIYGVAEYPKQHAKSYYPERRDPITNRNHEYLEQVINSNIEPRVKASVLAISDPNGGFIFVVNVEQGETAHQAKDNRYYRRYNFQNQPMRDYEVRDIMNRSKHPVVRMSFRFEGELLIATLVNEGQVLARNMRCLYRIPKFWLRDSPIGASVELIRHTLRGDHDYHIIDDAVDHVLHSGLSIEIKRHIITEMFHKSTTQRLSWPRHQPISDIAPVIYWKVYADNAKAVEGEMSFDDCLANSKRIGNTQ
nr:ATP-binding protein [Chryseolinea lacunae]